VIIGAYEVSGEVLLGTEGEVDEADSRKQERKLLS